MKSLLFLLTLLYSYVSIAQNKELVEPIEYYILSDSIVAQYSITNEYSEVRNTDKGIVVYRPSRSLLKLSNGSSKLYELDGFEYYSWNIYAKESNQDTIILRGRSPEVWGKMHAVFTLTRLSSNLRKYKRVIYDEENQPVLEFEKVITEKINIANFVCFSEPSPKTPGESLPFIPIDLNNLRIAQRSDFTY